MSNDVERLKLADALTHLLEECRMVLPGVQALFGFQLIATFNAGFDAKLSPFEQKVHLVALACVAVAGALIMTPAALHRGAREASERFIQVSGRLLLAAMLSLMAGICIDFYLIAGIILRHGPLAGALSLALVGFIGFFWFVFPRIYRRRHGQR